MTALQLQLLIAVARTLRNMASNPLAAVGTSEITQALLAVEAEARAPRLAPLHPEPSADVLRRAEDALVAGTGQ